MSVILIDATNQISGVFDGGNQPGSPKWDAYAATGGGPGIVGDGRGGRCIRITGYSTNWYQQGMYKTYAAATEIIASAYMRFSAASGRLIWNFYVGGGSGFALDRLIHHNTIYGDGKMRLIGNATSDVKAIGSFLWPVDTWVHLEVYLKIHPTTGRFISKVTPIGGVTTTDIDFTGDTGTGTSQALNWLGDRGDLGGSHDLADVVIRVGESNLYGVTRVRALRPVAAGTYTQLTPTPSVANYATQAELPSDDDLTYSAGVSGVKDLYTFSDLRPLDVPKLAQLVMYAKNPAPFVYTSFDHFGSNTADLAFDGNDSTQWYGNTWNAGQYLRVDFGVAKTVTNFRVFQTDTGCHYAPSVILQSSDDGAIWTTRNTLVNPAQDTGVLAVGGGPITARYWQILPTGGGACSPGINTFDLFISPVSIAALAKTGAESQGATKVLDTSYKLFVETYAADPADASAWTKAKIDAAEFGTKVVA